MVVLTSKISECFAKASFPQMLGKPPKSSAQIGFASQFRPIMLQGPFLFHGADDRRLATLETLLNSKTNSFVDMNDQVDISF